MQNLIETLSLSGKNHQKSTKISDRQQIMGVGELPSLHLRAMPNNSM